MNKTCKCNTWNNKAKISFKNFEKDFYFCQIESNPDEKFNWFI